MAQSFPASWGNPVRSAPYSRAFTGAAVLTSQVDQAQCASSGGLLIVTTTSPTFAYKDCTGTTVTVALGTMNVGDVVDFNGIAMTEIVTLTNATFLAYWHGSGSRI